MTLRLVALSDTHLRHIRHEIHVPPGDILIHAGDAMIEGTELEAQAFFQWFGALPHRHKVYIAGNHDWIFQKDPELARSLVPAGVTYLEDSEAVVAGLRFYGSPWSPEFMDWAFNLPRGPKLRDKWKRIPTGLDVLVTHTPPKYTLDRVIGRPDEYLGCADLRQAVEQKKPRVHVFGHIHTGHGTMEREGTKFVNGAICDEAYHPRFQPIEFDLEPLKGP